MAKLSRDQIEYLQKMNIPLSRVFDATGLGRKTYHKVMHDLGLWIAYGVSPCKKGGHTLKTRTGHCIQCDSANISYLRRHDESGFVYVAQSESKNLVKVGTSQNSVERISNLNSYRYGGVGDWEKVLSARCERAGNVEFLAHKALVRFATVGYYLKDGYEIECRELFSCDTKTAIMAVNNALKGISAEIIGNKNCQPDNQKCDADTSRNVESDKQPSQTQRTVSTFAREIQFSVSALLDQLNKAGVVKLSGEAPLSKQDVLKFLDYQRDKSKPRTLGVSEKKKVVLVERPPNLADVAIAKIPAPKEISDPNRTEIKSPNVESVLLYDWPGSYQPFRHQVTTTEFLVQHPRAFCLNDMGSGKSVSTLWAFDYLRLRGYVKRMLIVSPLSTLQRTWGDEISRNLNHLRYMVLTGTGAERRKRLREPADIYIINHDGLKIAGMVEAFALRPDIDLVIIDEIAQVARNASTDRFRALNTVVNKQVPRWAYGLTGTPIPNNPTDAWAQCRLLVPDKVPPYFNRFKDQVMRPDRYRGWVSKPEATNIVAEAMQPSIRFMRDECIDLPPVTYQTRTVEMTAEQKRLYREMLIRLRAEVENGEITAANEMVKANKLLQIASGAAYQSNGQTAFITPKERLEVTEEIAEEASGSIIVFVPFIGALKAVAEYLASKGVTVGLIHGAVSGSERDRIFKAFQDDRTIRALVAQPASMAHGLNLTAANTIIWFGPVYSNEIYQQSCARITRPGQIRKQLIVHIEGCPAEERVYRRLREKGRMQGLLLELLKDMRIN